MKNQRVVRRPGKRVLTAIAAALKEIEAYFELEGFGSSEPDVAEMGRAEGGPESDDESEEEDNEEEEEFSGTSVFEREDVEVAIDVFLSRLIGEGVLKKAKPGERPSFSGIFERIFGEDHKISDKAQTFEEHIEGYFGSIGYDDMSAAHEDLIEIREIIEQELNR